MIKKHSRNVHEIVFKGDAQIAMLSDIHWDNPHCDRETLKKHLDYCLKNEIPIMINGDFFCFMQGKYDPRRSKADIRPEHNKVNYIDAVIEDCVNWWKPYAHLLTVIGYGNHECYREDTEALTDKGWKLIKDIAINDNVATFDRNNIYFEKPIAVVSKNVDKLIHIEGSYSKQVVSGKHAFMYNNMDKVNAEDVKKLNDRDFPHGRVASFSQKYTPELIKLITCVVMDATLVDHSKYNKSHTKKRIQFKISKPSKIAYIRSVLEKNNIPYTFTECKKSGLNKLQPYYIRIYGDAAKYIFDLVGAEKKLPSDFMFIGGENYLAFLECLVNTDGYSPNKNAIEWNSTSKINVDIAQAMVTLNGNFFTYKEKANGSGFENGKIQYRCKIYKSIIKDRSAGILHENINSTVYCLNMPSGCFVTRIDGKVAFSGNTAIIKNLETDPLQRFVDLLNHTCKVNVHTGGYGGWLILKVHKKTCDAKVNVKYYHGSGGGGLVTKGAINLTRALEMVEGMDVFTMGHIHENSARNDVREKVEFHSMTGHRVLQQNIHLMLTGTYKDEYEDGFAGYHIEKGRPAKPIGGRILNIYTSREGTGTRKMSVVVDSCKFPV